MEDGRTRYNKAKMMLRNLRSKYDKISYATLTKEITIDIGSTDKTISEVVKLMIDTGLITEVDHLTFEINGQ